jgi:hypothetical protein
MSVLMIWGVRAYRKTDAGRIFSLLRSKNAFLIVGSMDMDGGDLGAQ